MTLPESLAWPLWWMKHALCLAWLLALAARADCGGEEWHGLRVSQDDQARQVTISADGGSITRMRESWWILGNPGGNPSGPGRATFHYCPDPALARLELDLATVDGVDLLASADPRLSARLDHPTDGEVRLEVSGLRPGDQLQLGWRLTRRPLIPGHAFTVMVLDKPYPVRHSSLRVEAPAHLTLHQGGQDTDRPPILTRTPTHQTLTWVAGPRQPGHDTDRIARLMVGTAGDWDVVRTWYRRHFLAAATVGASALKVVRTADGRLDFAALLAWLDGAVRPVDRVAGADAWLPRPADLVLASGEGDCKDRAVVVLAALRQAGIAARPVLWSPLRIAAELPNPYIFTHALLRVDDGSDEVLLDPLGGTIHRPDDFAGHLLDLGPGIAMGDPS